MSFQLFTVGTHTRRSTHLLINALQRIWWLSDPTPPIMVIPRALSVGRLRGMNLLPGSFRKFIEVLDREMRWMPPPHTPPPFLCIHRTLHGNMPSLYFTSSLYLGASFPFSFGKLASVDNIAKGEKLEYWHDSTCVDIWGVSFSSNISCRLNHWFRSKFCLLSFIFHLQQKTYDGFVFLYTWQSECELWLNRSKLWIAVYVNMGRGGWCHLAWKGRRFSHNIYWNRPLKPWSSVTFFFFFFFLLLLLWRKNIDMTRHSLKVPSRRVGFIRFPRFLKGWGCVLENTDWWNRLAA